MSILAEFYRGEINPSERFIKKESEYYKMSATLSDIIDEFIKLLNDEEYELFEKITDSISQIDSISEEECFTKGFCTGVKMILEVLNHKSNNFNNF